MRKSHPRLKLNVIVVTMVFIVWLLAINVAMAQGPVTNTNDTGDGSLRYEITNASADDVITFDPSLNGQTITLTGGEIDIDKPLTIDGPGAALLIISGNNHHQYQLHQQYRHPR